jgi:hypothetical protein
MTNDQQFVLVKADKSRGRGHWSDDDYDVRVGDLNGPILGRINRVPVSPPNRPWFWTITQLARHEPTSRGYAPTREDAMAAFKSAWDPMPVGKRNVPG